MTVEKRKILAECARAPLNRFEVPPLGRSEIAWYAKQKLEREMLKAALATGQKENNT